ncbi:putative UDP-N-acetylglucosamine 1-carboxyvinyltransferase [Xylariaceae sp. FL0662B]|nr:putative UDP-N-acetylglucosamine 1-carboxyvinyltransferase [Xylariaceae sp. FL0662B]
MSLEEIDCAMKSSNGSLDLLVEGGNELRGEIIVNSSKNAAVGLLCASLLNKGMTRLINIPRIGYVDRLCEVIESIGVEVRWLQGNDLVITPPAQLDATRMNTDAASQTRSIIMLIGPLMHHAGEFRIPYAGGCELGQRTILPHLYALEEFGVKVTIHSEGYYTVRSSPRVPGRPVVLYESGDTVTENVLMAAALTPGITVIKMASANYMVQDMCYFLLELGIRIDGIGSGTLIVHGTSSIRNRDAVYAPTEDPIEAMTFLAAGVATNSRITIRRVPLEFLELELLKLEKMGFAYETSKAYKARNGRTDLVDLTTHKHDDGGLRALPDKLHPNVFPGLNIDNLPLFVPVAAVARGRTLFHDWVFEGRGAMYAAFRRLGVDAEVVDPHRVYVTGSEDPARLRAANLACPPAIRPAAALVVGMMAAPGGSRLRDAGVLLRGYEDLAGRLAGIGAKVCVTCRRDDGE